MCSLSKRYLISGLILISGLTALGSILVIQDIRASFEISDVSFQNCQGYGNCQVQQMLKDRPRMATYTNHQGKKQQLTSQDSIWNWASQVYGATINGSKIAWDNSDISDKPLNYVADHDIPTLNSPGAIRLRSSVIHQNKAPHTLTFEELWNACIFELINIQKADRFLQAYTKALNGTLKRSEFVRFCKETEYQSLVELKGFYLKVWKPWAERQNLALSEKLWEQDIPLTYDAWITQYKSGSAYNYWEDYYDQTIAPAVKSQKIKI